MSDTTGFTPFYPMYSRNVKLPPSMLPQVNEGNFFEERLDNLSNAFKVAKELTQKSRALNRYRLKRKSHNNNNNIRFS